jgi:hypothetical protein
MGDQPVARPLSTQDNKTQNNGDRHPCLEWDSNPRSQSLSGRRYFVALDPHGHCDGLWLILKLRNIGRYRFV